MSVRRELGRLSEFIGKEPTEDGPGSGSGSDNPLITIQTFQVFMRR